MTLKVNETPNKGTSHLSDSCRMSSKSNSRREKNYSPLTKVVVRRLPPSMTEEEFIEVISPIPENDYFIFVPADKSLGSFGFCRVYINFKNHEEIYEFRDKFDSYVFVDQKGNEYPAIVEYAPFQKIPKKLTGRKDVRCGTIDQDTDYLAFLESLENPEPIQTAALEVLVEEYENRERELKANNGVIKMKTPLLEYIEQKKAERLRSKEERREERRKKDFERKKARDDKKDRKRDGTKKRDDYREDHWDDYREERLEEKSKPSPRVDRHKHDYGDPTFERLKLDREKEKVEKARERIMKREEERLERQRMREKERLRARQQRFEKEEKWKHSDEHNKSRDRDYNDKRISEKQRQPFSEEKLKLEGGRSKRYSEARRKDERDRDKKDKKAAVEESIVEQKNTEEEVTVKDDEDSSVVIITEAADDKEVEDEKTSVIDNETENRAGNEVEEFPIQEERKTESVCSDGKETSQKDEDSDMEREDTKSPEGSEDKDDDKPKFKKKDPRMERRIRNKDRPAMQIYRPGQSRLSIRMKQNQEDGSRGDSSSSSPSPVMSSGDDAKSGSERKTLRKSGDAHKIKQSSQDSKNTLSNEEVNETNSPLKRSNSLDKDTSDQNNSKSENERSSEITDDPSIQKVIDDDEVLIESDVVEEAILSSNPTNETPEEETCDKLENLNLD